MTTELLEAMPAHDHRVPVTCPDCGEDRLVLAGNARKLKTGRCISCNGKHNALAKRGLRPKQQFAPSTCRHHWMINDFNFGTCKKCDATRQFPYLTIRDRGAEW